ncbi:hypothetical protein BC830DRAFT_1148947 [Chytriomyces sp. MP71]|nr:hypothetical protein BC830DRAFT_1148947 [Chytriomyces sp. MP71]
MNPVHVAVTIACYLVFILVGKSIMRALPRFEIKTFALCHNLFLTSLSVHSETIIGCSGTQSMILRMVGLWRNWFGCFTSPK